MIGSVVGNYKIIDKIGEGGMGSVFKGVDLMLEREVAIKMLRPELARQPNVVERFRTEAVTLAKLNHPNVATLHSFFRQADDFFMVMEFVRGETLDDVIRAQGAMQCDQAIELFCMALEGIDHAHKASGVMSHEGVTLGHAGAALVIFPIIVEAFFSRPRWDRAGKRSAFERYNIVSDGDLREAVAKLAARHGTVGPDRRQRRRPRSIDVLSWGWRRRPDLNPGGGFASARLMLLSSAEECPVVPRSLQRF